jgi:hypothetical protein
MAVKRILTVLLFAFVVFSLGYLFGKEAGIASVPPPAGGGFAGAGAGADVPAGTAPGPAPGTSGEADPAPPAPPRHQVVAYYFHATKRCEKCNTIEAYSHEAITQGFPERVASGEIRWEVVDMDQPWNQHFVQRYELTNANLVLSDRWDGEERDFTVCRRTWDLTGDKEAFLAYVKGEVEMALESEPPGGE